MQPAAPPPIPTPVTEPATDGNVTFTSLPTSIVAFHSNTSTNGDVRLIVASQPSDQVRGANDPGQSLLTYSEQTVSDTHNIEISNTIFTSFSSRTFLPKVYHPRDQ